MGRERGLAIEVVHALPQEQIVIALTVPAGTSVRDAIHLSGLDVRIPGFDFEKARFGIYGRLVAADAVVCEGDRVEIYRPLIADAKQARRRRAERNA